MTTSRRPLPRRLPLGALVLALAVSACGDKSRAALPYPNSIAAIGDSWTAPLCIQSGCAALPADSWATGSNPAVNSLYQRILAHNPAIRGRNFNLSIEHASAGPAMDDLAFQAARAIAKHVDYVVIALGENDACRGTPVGVFSREFAAGLARLTRALPRAHIFVLSIENVASQWRTLDADHAGRRAFNAGYSLDCGLGATATPAALAAVASHIAVLNGKLDTICRTSARCRYDRGAVYRMHFKASYFSKYDLQHLSVAGQHALSSVAWTAGYRFEAP